MGGCGAGVSQRRAQAVEANPARKCGHFARVGNTVPAFAAVGRGATIAPHPPQFFLGWYGGGGENRFGGLVLGNNTPPNVRTFACLEYPRFLALPRLLYL